jgi:hypothetical protein
MSEFKAGTIVTTYLGGGMVGEILGTSSSNGLTGNFYMIKILDRGFPESEIEKAAPTWKEYPGEYTVLSEKVLYKAASDLVSTLKSLGKISQDPDGKVVQNERAMRIAVKNLNIDDTQIKKFLEKAAREYMKSRGEKCEIIEVYPLDFIVRLKAKYGYGGATHLRVPVADFFEGKSKVAQMSVDMRNALKEQGAVVVELEDKKPPTLEEYAKDKAKHDAFQATLKGGAVKMRTTARKTRKK